METSPKVLKEDLAHYETNSLGSTGQRSPSENSRTQSGCKLLVSIGLNHHQRWWQLQEEQFRWNLPDPLQLTQPKYLEIQIRTGFPASIIGAARWSLSFSTLFHQCGIKWKENVADELQLCISSRSKSGARNIDVSLSLLLIIPCSSVQMVWGFEQVSDDKLGCEIKLRKSCYVSSFSELKIFLSENKTL